MRAVFFEVDGVLLHSLFHPDPARRRGWDAHVAEDLGLAPEAMNGFFATHFPEAASGRLSLIAALQDYLPTVGHYGTAEDFLSRWLLHDTDIDLPLLEALRQLRAAGNTALYLASDQDHLRAVHLWNEIGLRHYFDDMFFAAQLGADKRDAAFYAQVEAQIGPQDEPPLLFDDSRTALAVAAEAGWEGVLYRGLADVTDHPWIAGQLSAAHSLPPADPLPA
jgi:putative hydrolase of the HAD superfamily